MERRSRVAGGGPSRSWAQWTDLRPTQGAIGYIQVQGKTASYLALEPERRRAFVEEQAIKVVSGPSGLLHIIDHHHWARTWFDLGLPEAPISRVKDFSGLDEASFLREMAERSWWHPVDPDGHEYPVSQLPKSIATMPDDVYLSVAAFLRMAGIYDNPGEFSAKFAWAAFMRQRVAKRPSTVDGFARMLAEAFGMARLPEAKALPGYKDEGGSGTAVARQ
ncbi:ParB/Srx family N-terminal domain-containing protein [Bordetella genomosp. 13]|uniref:ParB/Srx family N-terminal domain-containing protein n=1 Tax=Bordetella genomosp. 13 TaxID=463040 RepID=UPI001642B35B|nr:ParB/Srx family N-terminal domain-containing protein [Bordetella genomosp. 13]